MYNQYMKAIINNITIATSNDTVIVEGNHYFPKDSLEMKYFKSSSLKTNCPWKGEASYYDLQIGDTVYEGVAWYYQQPSDLATNIKDHVAFWKEVMVVEN